jgi:hypothetical protein
MLSKITMVLAPTMVFITVLLGSIGTSFAQCAMQTRSRESSSRSCRGTFLG